MDTNGNNNEVNKQVTAVTSVQPETPINGKTSVGEKKRCKKKSNLETVLESARRLYQRQVVKDNKTWKAVIERSIQMKFPNETYTLSNFLSELGQRMFRLLDSKRFEKDCNKYSIDVFVAATHISLQSITRLYAVLDYGLDSVEAGFNAYICNMKEIIFDYDEFPNADVLLGYTPVPTGETQPLAKASE